MKKLNLLFGLIFLCGFSAFSSAITVQVASPVSGSTVSSPVQISALASSGHRITGWWIYVDNVGVWSTGATARINPSIAMSAGTHKVTVRAWNTTGSYSAANLTLTVNSPTPPPTPTVSVSVSPQNATLQVGASSQFTASVTGTTNTAVTWLVNGIQGGNSTVGTISVAGLYNAPATVPASSTVTVTTRSVADATKSANAAVSIQAAPTPVSVAISPTTAARQTGSTLQFGATVTGTTNTSVTWLVNGVQGGNSTVGTISTTGFYTAPSAVPSGGTATVTAKSVYDSTKSANAIVTITAAPATVAVAVSPTSASVQTAKTQQFTASVTGTTNTAVNWQVNGITGGNSTVGLISGGMYTAPAAVPSGGAVNVTALSAADSTKSASATVSIAAAPPTGGGTANYYVSPTGSNSNPCTQAAPCADPAYVVNNKAVAGNTVQAAPGTYNYGTGYANFAKSGTSGNYIKVVCATRGACKIQNSVTGNATVVYMRGSYLQLTGFEVTNTGTPGNNLGLYVEGSNILINQNTIHHIETNCTNTGGGGIQVVNGAGNIVMDSNLIYDIGWARGCPASTVQFDGIIAETIGSGIVITNNVVYHVAGGWGILYGNSSGSSGSAVISNNTVFSNANGGIALVNGGDYSTISNNNVLNNGVVSRQCGIWTIYAADSHVLISRNNVYGNLGGDYCHAGTPIKSGNISVNPALGTTFANWQADGSGDYHLKAGSPLVNAGGSTCASGSPAYISPGVCAPPKDYDLNARPNGGVWDIGAYEY